MPSNYWLKLYHEILDDPKMGRLDDRSFRRVIQCFLLAGDLGTKRGDLPSLPDIAWRLHWDQDELEADLQLLLDVGILSRDEAGVFYVTAWEQRQAPMSDVDRQQRHRKRSRKQEYYGHEPDNTPVTTRDTDIDLDTDESRVEVEAEAIPAAAAPELRPEPNADPVVAHLFSLLDKAAVIVNGRTQAEAWTDLLDITRDKGLLSETFAEAANSGKHPMPNWCRAVLERCIRDNTRPGKWNGDGRARDEPPGPAYARDGPLETFDAVDNMGNIIKLTK